MAKLSHRLEYILALSFARLSQLLPAAVADRVGAALGGLTYLLLASRRRITIDNLTQSLGSSFDPDELKGIARRVFQNLGRSLFELARFKRLRMEGVKRICQGGDDFQIKKAMDEGKGLIILVAHYGNWELTGNWVASHGYKTHFLVAVQHNPYVDKMLTSFRTALGADVITTTGSVRSVFRALKNNEIVVMASDQHDPSGNLTIDFMGRQAAIAKGSAIFAHRAGCPILPCLMRRERYDRHVVMLGDLIYPDYQNDEDEEIKRLTLAHTAFLEDRIRAYPDQWMWTHRRWKI